MAKVKKLNGNFTLVANTWLKDTKLSAKAKGILCYLQSVADDWEYSIAGLVTQFKDGYDSIKSGIDELVEAGYIEWKRNRNSDGTLADVDVQLREKPIKEKSNSGKSLVGENGNNKIKTNTKERLEQNKETLTKVKEETSEIVSGEVVEVKKSYGNSDINELFQLWEQNCGFPIKNKVQLNRFACQRLIKSRGMESIRAVLSVLPETFDDRYAPSVNNFMDLEEKWDNLRTWYRKRANASRPRTVIQDGVEYTYDQNGKVLSVKI